MAKQFTTKLARLFLEQQYLLCKSLPNDEVWVEKIQRFSDLCEEADIRTHVVFLGVSLLARSMDQHVDLNALKPNHDRSNPNAYSARSLAHSVLVPFAAAHGINIGATGAEPLNNQPYFRMKNLRDNTPLQERSKRPFNFMLSLLEELCSLDEEGTKAALRAFLTVRKSMSFTYEALDGRTEISLQNLATMIDGFVTLRSEGGKRAQACVAGIFDVAFGPRNVEAGRINDPSRHSPGDVCVKGRADDSYEIAVEVKDKPIRSAAIMLFAQNCLRHGVKKVGVVAVASRQPPLDVADLQIWASNIDLDLTLFTNWFDLVQQAAFWRQTASESFSSLVYERIYERLIEVEISQEGAATWKSLAIAEDDRPMGSA